MIPWWWLLVTGLFLPSVAVVLFGAVVVGARADDRQRLMELEKAADSAYADLVLAADPSMDQCVWLDSAGETLARVLGRPWE